MQKGHIIFVALVLLVCAGVFMFTSEQVNAPVVDIKDTQDEQYVSEPYQNRLMDIETYVTTNISQLSPVQEVLGGKFYVTEIHTDDGEGVVRYEDGHNTYVADFKYTSSETQGYTVTQFTVRTNR